jgi:hypothetical protein
MDIRRKAREYVQGFFKTPTKLTEQDMVDFASRIQRETIEECILAIESAPTCKILTASDVSLLKNAFAEMRKLRQ